MRSLCEVCAKFVRSFCEPRGEKSASIFGLIRTLNPMVKKKMSKISKKAKVESCSIAYIPLDTVTKISHFLEYGKEVNNLFEALVVFKSVGPLARDYVFLQNKQFCLIKWSNDVFGRLQRKTERQFLDYKEILDANPLGLCVLEQKNSRSSFTRRA